jgi:antagonist of KipI
MSVLSASIDRSIEVLEPGLFTTVQDLGRPGYGPMGVSASGAADAVSLRIGNLLVGNREGAPALEMTLSGGTFLFPQGGVVALTGSDFGAALPLWTACTLEPGAVLRCGAALTGARGYLCVRGGFSVPMFLGSASTHVLSGLGGHLVARGDILRIGEEGVGRVHEVNPGALLRLSARKVIRATDGPQWDWFAKSFFDSEYCVTEEANRMGLRLSGATFEMEKPGKMLSEGVALGAVQIAAGGQPIIMFVEQQTTGGYPKIANVIAADLHCVGQLRPRDRVRFVKVTVDEAREALRKQEKLIGSGDLFI